jgi:hypothetical protein
MPTRSGPFQSHPLSASVDHAYLPPRTTCVRPARLSSWTAAAHGSRRGWGSQRSQSAAGMLDDDLDAYFANKGGEALTTIIALLHMAPEASATRNQPVTSVQPHLRVRAGWRIQSRLTERHGGVSCTADKPAAAAEAAAEAAPAAEAAAEEAVAAA